MAWHVGPLLGFDTETTGVDVFTDRVVTAATVLTEDGSDEVRTWLDDPGVEIPAGAAAVPGITTAHAACARAPARADHRPTRARPRVGPIPARKADVGVPLRPLRRGHRSAARRG